MINLKDLLIRSGWDYEVISNNGIDNLYISSVNIGMEQLKLLEIVELKLSSSNMTVKGNVTILEVSEVLDILNAKVESVLPEVFLITSEGRKNILRQVESLVDNYCDCSIICITSDVTPQEVYIEIMKSIRDESTYIHDLIYEDYINLVHLLTQGAEINEIEAMAYEILGNPMIITDESYKVIAYSHNVDVNDPIWMTIVGNDYCPFPIVEMTDYNNFWQRLSRSNFPLFVDSKDFSPYVMRAVAEIRAYGKVKGYIALLEINKKITNRDLQVLQMVAELIGVKLAEKDAVSRAVGHLRYEFIRDLFSGVMVSEDMAQNRAKSMKLITRKLYAVMCIETRDEDIYIGTKLDGIKSRLKNYFPFCINSLSNRKVFFILSFDDRDRWNRLIRNEIEEFMSDEGLLCSVGTPVDTMICIHESYMQAKKVSEIIHFLGDDLKKRSVYIYI